LDESIAKKQRSDSIQKVGEEAGVMAVIIT
jgi:hypothetical protein